MATRVARCPHCATTFRVAEEQLHARSGWVRCGACRQVFQADEGAAKAVPPTATTPPASIPGPSSSASTPAVVNQPIFTDTATPSSARVEPGWSESPKPSLDSDTPAPAFTSIPVAPKPDIESDYYVPQSRVDDMRGPYPSAGGLSFQAAGAAGYLRVLWAIGFIVAVLLLFGQALWWWRTPIATYVPAARPLLESACSVMGCTVGYVRKPAQLTIESSSVQPVSVAGTNQANHLMLSALVRNRAPHAQPWPALELSLTDYADTVVIQRVLQPEEYLDASVLQQPFAAHSEQNITVEFTAQGVPVSGYRIGLFFP